MKMGIIKQCEFCKKYRDCKIYDKVCDNLEFLQNFLDLKESEDIAKYCKDYNAYTKNEIKKFWRITI